jgi:hypothetical protein
MSQDTAPRLPRPTLHTAHYVNWSDVCRAAQLTRAEIEEAEAILEQHYTWGEAEITLADAPHVQQVIEEAVRAVTPMTEADRRDYSDVLNSVIHADCGGGLGSADYINLEA